MSLSRNSNTPSSGGLAVLQMPSRRNLGGNTRRSDSASAGVRMEAARKLCAKTRDPVDGSELTPAEAYAQSDGLLFASGRTQFEYFDSLEKGTELLVQNGRPSKLRLEKTRLWQRNISLRGKSSQQQFVASAALQVGEFAFTVDSSLIEQGFIQTRKATIELQVSNGGKVLMQKVVVLNRRHPREIIHFKIEPENENTVLLAKFACGSAIKPVHIHAALTFLAAPEFVKRAAKARHRSRSLIKPQEYMVEILKGPSGMGMSLCWNQNLRCALVSSVERDGPADLRGMIAIGDHVKSIQGIRVENIPFEEQLQMIRDVPKYLVLVLREGSPRTCASRSSDNLLSDEDNYNIIIGNDSSTSLSSLDISGNNDYNNQSEAMEPRLSDALEDYPEDDLELDQAEDSLMTRNSEQSLSPTSSPCCNRVKKGRSSTACSTSSAVTEGSTESSSKDSLYEGSLDEPVVTSSSSFISSGKERVCSVCMQSDAITPASLSCDHGHILCGDCIEGFVQFASSVGNEDQLGKDRMSIKCVYPECTAPPISAHELAPHIPSETFHALLRAGLRSHEQTVLHDERERQHLKDTAIQKHVNYVADEILTLKCPRNGHPFVDFDGCLALTCTRCKPRCNFCAWCLADCGAISHSHVMRCPASLKPGSFFAPLQDVHKAHAKRAQNLFVEYWRDHVTQEPKHVREAVLDQIKATHGETLGPVLPEKA